MKRWFNKVAVVTGASSGIGASTVLELVKSGLVVVGLARRQHRVEDLKSELPESLRKNLHAIKCDISKEEEILSTFAEIEKKFGGVDVLVNNAGINRITSLIDSKNSEPIREVVDTNLMGLVFCTREAVQSMQKRNAAGHVIHINSIAGHYVPNVPMIDFSLNVYPATKHGVTALTETLRQDLNKMKSQIKITIKFGQSAFSLNSVVSVASSLLEMERWSGKVAVVTGASSGIGAATVIELVKAGLVVVGLARRQERVEELKKDVPEDLKKNLHSIKCDVSKEDEILSTFAAIEKKFGGVDVLVNNAGITRNTTLIDNKNSEPIREVVDTNVLGLVFCTREAVQSMQKRNVAGHIIHINSVAGHIVPNIQIPDFSMNIYPATKHAVTALTETLRQDLNKLKSQIKVTSISPGGVKTEIIPEGLLQLIEEGKLVFPMLEAVDIADAVLYVLGTPPRVQIHELTIRPIGEQF